MPPSTYCRYLYYRYGCPSGRLTYYFYTPPIEQSKPQLATDDVWWDSEEPRILDSQGLPEANLY